MQNLTLGSFLGDRAIARMSQMQNMTRSSPVASNDRFCMALDGPPAKAGVRAATQNGVR
jgi:hypothetical protein